MEMILIISIAANFVLLMIIRGALKESLENQHQINNLKKNNIDLQHKLAYQDTRKVFQTYRS